MTIFAVKHIFNPTLDRATRLPHSASCPGDDGRTARQRPRAIFLPGAKIEI